MRKPQDTLSQHEIDALLTAVHSGSVAVSSGSPAPRSAPVRYNFRRPSRVSKDQIRGLQIVHDDFAKLVAGSLSSMLRTLVDVDLEAVEQTAYGEYVSALTTPTCAFVFNMEPLKGGAVLEVNPQLSFVMIDRLLGGRGVANVVVREFTEIERAVVDRVAFRAMVDMQQAWQQVGAFVFRVLNLETNPQLIQVTSPNEVAIVATFRVKVGDVSGSLSVCYPHVLLEPRIHRIGTQRWQAHNVAPHPVVRARVLRELAQSPLELRAFLGETTLTVRELLGLQPGQVVSLGSPSKDPVRVEVNGVAKFAGRPGTHRKHLAVEILTRIDDQGDTVPDPAGAGSRRSRRSEERSPQA
jgi:flagellar motor switch protein FliM